MSNQELSRKLQQLKTEDLIWVVYIGIIVLSWYANDLERKYFICRDIQSKKEYRKTIILIFTILTCAYLYFLKSSWDDFNNLKESDTDKKKLLTSLSLLCSFLIALTGFIFLYIAINDEEVDVEIAFN